MRYVLVLVAVAAVLFGCTGCGVCLPFVECPMYAMPPDWYYSQCDAQGGSVVSDQDPLTCCYGPPYCVGENGEEIILVQPTPPPPTPPSTPSGNEDLKCENSGGDWISVEGYSFCDCGYELVYNSTSSECEECPPGQLVGRGIGPGFCYTPTGKQGDACDSELDCEGGYCILVDENAATGKGVCSDLPFGCHVFIDKNGDFDTEAILCVD